MRNPRSTLRRVSQPRPHRLRASLLSRPYRLRACLLSRPSRLRAFLLCGLMCVLPAACGGGEDEAPAADTTAATGPARRLTEAEVIGAVLSATDAMARTDSAATGVIAISEVHRFAEVLRTDERAIAEEMRAVADSLGVAGANSATGDRLRAEAERLASTLTDSTAGPSGSVGLTEAGKAATHFVQSRIELQRHLLGAVDSLLLPSSRTPLLRQTLTDLRTALVAHLQRAEQLETILANAAAAPREEAARISPDSARMPGDTTADLPPAPPPPGSAPPDSTPPAVPPPAAP
jgi:hypothetical protein